MELCTLRKEEQLRLLEEPRIKIMMFGIRDRHGIFPWAGPDNWWTHAQDPCLLAHCADVEHVLQDFLEPRRRNSPTDVILNHKLNLTSEELQTMAGFIMETKLAMQSTRCNCNRKRRRISVCRKVHVSYRDFWEVSMWFPLFVCLFAY